jgi:hypothetical protein
MSSSPSPRRSFCIPVEYDVASSFPAEGFQAFPAQNPEEGIDDVAFSRAVGADDRSNAGMEDNLGSLREGFETLEFQSFYDHCSLSKSLSLILQ